LALTGNSLIFRICDAFKRRDRKVFFGQAAVFISQSRPLCHLAKHNALIRLIHDGPILLKTEHGIGILEEYSPAAINMNSAIRASLRLSIGEKIKAESRHCTLET
jgi:hypothetical protein